MTSVLGCNGVGVMLVWGWCEIDERLVWGWWGVGVELMCGWCEVDVVRLM